MTIAKALKQAGNRLNEIGMKTARLDALILLEYAVKKDRSWLLALPEFVINARSRNVYEKLIHQRMKHIPIAYLIGHKEFYRLNFKVTPYVLIPRPETESLVELALGFKRINTDVLDVGTGCGAIAIAIAKKRPKWNITASEVSKAALKVAQFNAKKNDVKIEFIESDLFKNISGSFNIIVANLPYVKSKAQLTPGATAEPGLALFGGQDGLDYYRKFFDQISSYLKKHSLVIIEADPWQHPELILIASANGLKLIEDDRFAICFLNS